MTDKPSMTTNVNSRGNKKSRPPSLPMFGWTVGGLLRFLNAWEFKSCGFSEILKSGGFASPKRYFYFTAPGFSNSWLLFSISFIFFLYAQKSRTEVRDLCLHLFCQCKLARKEGFEPSHVVWTPTPLAGEPLRPLGYFRRNKNIHKMAERVGFEPTDAHTSPVFKTGSLNRSDTSPVWRIFLSYYIMLSSICQW